VLTPFRHREHHEDPATPSPPEAGPGASPRSSSTFR
jgi:hypothetical protein